MSSTAVSGTTAQSKQPSKPHRLPAPALFVGPPSRNASALSVGRLTADQRPGLNRKSTARSRIHNSETDGAAEEPSQNNDRTRNETFTFQKPSQYATQAKWREMQSVLNEVDLMAQSSTHVFGAEHARALDELRDAQVALAKAWGRGSEGDHKDAGAAASNAGNAAAVGEMNVARFAAAADGATTSSPQRLQRQRAETVGSASTGLSDGSGPSDGGSEPRGGQLEDETAQDIKLAGERRAANEAYFRKVDEGVKEVVERLASVAQAMRGVEAESRSLWSSSQSERSQRSEDTARRASEDTTNAAGTSANGG